MKRAFYIVLVLLFHISVFSQKPRLIVLTDIGQDPDDEQSMVRLLHYANEFQIEGLIATADNNYDKEPPIVRTDIIHKFIDDYEKTLPNFLTHSKDFPSANELRETVKRGNDKGGNKVPVKDFIGKDFDTDGSEWIIKTVDKRSNSPVNVAVWGGACDLAQALWKVKNTRKKPEVNEFVSKLRVYFIGKQDASNQWIIDNFPKLWLILALDRGGDKWQSGYRGMFWGGDMSSTTKKWIHENIHGHSPLADNFPDEAWTGGEGKNPHMALKEGDSPSMLYFIMNGLNSIENPEWGGWGGRYVEDKPNFFRDTDDSCYDVSLGKITVSPRTTVFRWRPDFQNDFAARIDWGAQKRFEKANHAPVVVVNGNSEKEPMVFTVAAGMELKLDATQTFDPDGDELTYRWFEYYEPGNCPEEINYAANDRGNANIIIPENTSGSIAHIILKVTDNGTPALCCYKRIVLNIQ